MYQHAIIEQTSGIGIALTLPTFAIKYNSAQFLPGSTTLEPELGPLVVPLPCQRPPRNHLVDSHRHRSSMPVPILRWQLEHTHPFGVFDPLELR
jgi:hypothetical protein